MAKKTKEPFVNPKQELRVSEADFPDRPDRDQLLSELAQMPAYTSASTVNAFSTAHVGELGITESFNAMKSKIAKVKAGDMSDMEGMLVAQATALDAIFTELARRAALNMGEYINAADTYMRLALKAQSQARATVETLEEIKNPRAVAFVRQANIANGPQQVNNGVGDSRAREKLNSSNELLEGCHGLLPYTGAAQATVRADSKMAPVGAVHRAPHQGG